MAKTKGGLFSIKANGSVGKMLTYCDYRGIQRVKMYKAPKMPLDPRSELQLSFRARWRDAVAMWASFTTGQKGIYNEKAKNKPLSGFNYFMKGYIGTHPILTSDLRFLPFWLDLTNSPV
jgi:hypothetical protein